VRNETSHKKGRMREREREREIERERERERCVYENASIMSLSVY
jgi:hypothetical protein